MHSIEDATRFVQDFNEDPFEGWKNEPATAIQVDETGSTVSAIKERMEMLKESSMLQISNLDPKLSEQELSQYINQNTGYIPNDIQFRRDLKGEYPSFAFIQMNTFIDAKSVVEKLQMSSLQGLRMFIRVIPPFDRKQFLKGLKGITEVEIWNVPQSVCIDHSHGNMKRFCSKYGLVTSMQITAESKNIVRDALQLKVTMSSVEGAIAVFDALHGMRLRGRTLSTKFHLEPSKVTSVLGICGLSSLVQEDDVRSFINQAVPHCPQRIEMYKVNGNKAAIVVFTVGSGQCVTECIDKLNGKTLYGNVVKLYAHHHQDAFTSILIQNLSRNVREPMILEHLRKHSQITNPPKLIRLVHHLTNESKLGFAVVQFENREDAVNAAKQLFLTEIDGREIVVFHNKNIMWHRSHLLPQERMEWLKGKKKEVTLFQLHYTVNKQDIETLCAPFGEMENVDIMIDSKGYPACTARVKMKSEESASRLFDGLHGHKIKDLPLSTSFGGEMLKLRVIKRQSKSTKGNAVAKKKLIGILNKMTKLKVTGKGRNGKTKAKGIGKGKVSLKEMSVLKQMSKLKVKTKKTRRKRKGRKQEMKKDSKEGNQTIKRVEREDKKPALSVTEYQSW